MKKNYFLLTFFISCLSLFSEFDDLNKNKITLIKPLSPNHQIDTSLNDTSDSKIFTYYTSDIFSFENKAKKACNEMLAKFKEYGVSTIGCNVFEKGNDYSYSIEYLPQLKNPEIISSFIIKEYIPLKTYWNENLAKNEMNISISKFQKSPLKILDHITIEIRDRYSFKIKYLVNNVLKKSREYYIVFNRTFYGKYTFESQAQKDSDRVLSLFKQKNICVISVKPLLHGDYYTLEVEYITKTDNLNKPSLNPEYSIENYTAEEVFSFENQAMKEGEKRNEQFLKAEIFVIHNHAIEKNNDWTFSLDYIVKNIYKNGFFLRKEFEIKRYINPISFNFENEAQKIMEEKINNFNQIGLYVISSKIYETGNGYSFYIDYIDKTNPKIEK